MMTPQGIPEIGAEDLAARRNSGDSLLLVDVREPRELPLASLDGNVLLVPLSQIARLGLAALPQALLERQREIVVFCHHGVRSAQVVAWLQRNGWTNVWNLRGGIDAYAREVDPSVGLY